MKLEGVRVPYCYKNKYVGFKLGAPSQVIGIKQKKRGLHKS